MRPQKLSREEEGMMGKRPDGATSSLLPLIFFLFFVAFVLFVSLW